MAEACAERRVAVLAGHLSRFSPGHSNGIGAQACAATQRIGFARVASASAFAQPVPACHAERATQEALMWADRTMSAVQARQRSAADVMEHHPSKVVSGLVDMTQEPAFAKAGRDSITEGRTAAALAAFHRHARRRAPAAKASRRVPTMRVQATETHTGYEIRVALPGVHADDVRLELVRGRQLTISGHQSSPKKADSGDRMLTVFNGGFLGPISIAKGRDSLFSATVNERAFSASCPLPRDADLASARAHLADGLLRITFRRKQ